MDTTCDRRAESAVVHPSLGQEISYSKLTAASAVNFTYEMPQSSHQFYFKVFPGVRNEPPLYMGTYVNLVKLCPFVPSIHYYILYFITTTLSE